MSTDGEQTTKAQVLAVEPVELDLLAEDTPNILPLTKTYTSRGFKYLINPDFELEEY